MHLSDRWKKLILQETLLDPKISVLLLSLQEGSGGNGYLSRPLSQRHPWTQEPRKLETWFLMSLERGLNLRQDCDRETTETTFFDGAHGGFSPYHPYGTNAARAGQASVAAYETLIADAAANESANIEVKFNSYIVAACFMST